MKPETLRSAGRNVTVYAISLSGVRTPPGYHTSSLVVIMILIDVSYLKKLHAHLMGYKMGSFIKYSLTLFLIASLFGCATTRGVFLDKTERLAKPKDYKVEIYDVAGAPRPYKVIGTVIASTGPFHHVMEAIQHLQDEARKIGGDALIDLAPGLPKGEPMPEGGWFIFGRYGEIWSAKVIVWE